jgi:hypothetical protein
MSIKSKILSLSIAGTAVLILTGCSWTPSNNMDEIAGISPEIKSAPSLYTIPSNASLPKSVNEARERWEAAQREERERWSKARTQAEKILVEPYKIYPKDFPIKQYPKSDVYFARTNAEEWKRQQLKVVVLSSKEAPSNICQYYYDQLTKSGWKIKSTEGNPVYRSVEATKDGSLIKISVYIDVYPGKTMVHIESKALKKASKVNL